MRLHLCSPPSHPRHNTAICARAPGIKAVNLRDATTAQLAGLPASAMLQPQDGLSLVPLMAGEIGPRTKPIPFRSRGRSAVIDNDYKILSFPKNLEPLTMDSLIRAKYDVLVRARGKSDSRFDRESLKGLLTHDCHVIT